MFETDAYETLFERIAAVRTHRDEFLAMVKTGAMTLEEIVARGADDPVIGSLKILPAVESLPEAGKVQTRRAFADVGIAEDGHIGDISAEQIAEMPQAMERHAR